MIEHEPDAFTPTEQAALQARGHLLKTTGCAYGNQQMLLWNKTDNQVQAASDRRGIGLSAVSP